MAGTDYRTVNIMGIPVMEEYVSAVTLTVGMVVQVNSSGQLALSSVALAYFSGGELVVTEAAERGKGIFSSGTTINTYVATEVVPVIAPARGDQCLALLTDGETITKGDLLEVAATGKLIASAGTNLVAFRALESLSPSGADGLIHVQRL